MTLMEFVSACFSPANAFYTVLLLGMFLYWIMVVWGMLDVELGTPEVDIDADLDLDLDADVDLDADLDVSGSAPEADGDFDADGHSVNDHAHVGEVLLDGDKNQIPDSRKKSVLRATPFYLTLMRWLGIGRVPLMVFLSVFVPLLWCFSFMATQHWGRSDGTMFLILLVPVVLAASVLSKFVTIPFGFLFRKANQPGVEDHEDLAGELCRIVSLTADGVYGQAELSRDGAPLALNVRTDGGVVLSRGDGARIVSGPDAKDVYVVEAAEDGKSG